jgi:hypothetical protein
MARIVEVRSADIPRGYEVQEVTDAKNEVYDVLWDNVLYPQEEDLILISEKIVETLTNKGWRPTVD